MTAQHTRGPWHAEPTPSSDFVTRRIYGPNGEMICDVGVPRRSNLDVHTEVANARLIVEAPAMLEALRKAEAFMAGFEGDDTQEEPIDGDLANMRAILARVEV